MLKTIIIDDEAANREVLEIMLQDFPDEIQVVASCNGPKTGMTAILQHKPDLVFLDIEMPGMSGFDLLEMLGDTKIAVVFVTAHNHYALQAIQFSAMDYLLKPVNPAQLKAAIEKAKTRIAESSYALQYKTFIENSKTHHNETKTIALPTQEGLVFVKINEILRCESNGNYTTIYLVNKMQYLVSRTLKEFEKLLEGLNFFRVHHSHLINLEHIKRYVKGEGGYVIMNDDAMVEVARSRKADFLQAFMKV
jgi:two-component system, LytTR family, response regulator